jgi:hypothetical protein
MSETASGARHPKRGIPRVFALLFSRTYCHLPQSHSRRVQRGRSCQACGSTRRPNGWGTDGQSEYFGRVASLDVVALALAGVAGDDGKVRASDGEDGAAIFCVRVELSLLRDCDGGHVGHEEGKEGGERRREGR